MTLTYTATFHVQASKTGGTIQFLYTWNNGRASPSGSVTIPPNDPSAVTFTYTATGRVGGAYAFPRSSAGERDQSQCGAIQSGDPDGDLHCIVSWHDTPDQRALDEQCDHRLGTHEYPPDLAYYRWRKKLAGRDPTLSCW